MELVMLQASCPLDGAVEVPIGAVTLVLMSVPERSFYEFVCPTCGDLVVKHAPKDHMRLLMTNGAQVTTVKVPAEALETHEGAPFTPDDVLDFALELADVDELVDFLR